MKKKLKLNFYFLAVLGLFTIYTFLNFWKIGIKELQGDEASSLLAVIPAMNFFKNPKWLASIFIFNHAPLRGLVEIPFLYLFGLKEFWLYLPNILAGLLLFWVIYVILLKSFNRKTAIIGTFFISVSGSVVLQRMVMGVGFFLLFTSLMITNFFLFLQSKKLNKLNLTLFFLFLSILTYVEAIIFIPAIIYWLIKKQIITNRRIIKRLFYFFVSLTVFLCLWLIIPLIAFREGVITNLSDAGIFRLINRASKGFYPDLWYSIKILRQYNSFAYVFLLISGLIFSFREKKSFYFWSFLLIPLIYFSLKANPTVHLFNYLNLVIIISCIGWKKIICESHNIIKLFIYLLMIFVVYINVSFLSKTYYQPKAVLSIGDWGQLNVRGIKSTAFRVRERTGVCDRIYTDIDGYIARLYFGRKYTNDPNKAKMVVLKKDFEVNGSKTKLFDQKYASFSNLMPYLQCQD